MPDPHDMNGADLAEILGANVDVPAHVVHREFPAETVMLNLRTGQYHGLNPTGGAMLVAREQQASVAEAARVVAARFRRPIDQVQRDMCDLFVALRERGLIEAQL